MDDERFAELTRPLLDHALARAELVMAPEDALEAVQAAATATWREFPRLRSPGEVVESFERHIQAEIRRPNPQRALGSAPVSAFWEDEVIELATAHDRRRPAQVHAPLLAAGIVTAIVVALLISPRLAPLADRVLAVTKPGQKATERYEVITQPSPPSPEEEDLGPVPLGPDLIWGIDARRPNWLVAFNHGGTPIGTLAVPETIELEPVPRNGSNTLGASPDGSVLWLGDRFSDRQGTTLGRMDVPAGSFVWTDQFDEVCGVSETASGEWFLWTYRLTGPTVPYRFPGAVSIVRRFQAAAFLTVAGCNVARKLAVVAEEVPGQDVHWVRQLDFVRLSDGAMMGTRSEPMDTYAGVVASPDLQYFAENVDPAPGPRPPGMSDVRRVENGDSIFRTPYTITGFSSDSTQVATWIFNVGAGPIYDLDSGQEVPSPEVNGAPADGIYPVSGDWVFAPSSGPGFILVLRSLQADYGPVTVIATTSPTYFNSGS